MKRTLIALISLAAFALGPANSQDVNEILDKYFETIGQKTLADIETMVATGKSMQMGMEMPFKTIQKRPNKALLEVEVQDAKMLMGYDGENGWMVAPWLGPEPIDLVGSDLSSLLEMSDMDGYLWNYEEKGH
jgi:outer membrane lipoprotein-sorting protein